MKKALESFITGLLLMVSTSSSLASGTRGMPMAGPQVSGAQPWVAQGTYLWGTNANGQLGFGPGPFSSPYAELVPLDGYARSVAAGPHHVIAALGDGRVYAWGASDLYTAPNNTTLHQIPVPSNAKSVAAGSVASYVLTEDGNLYSFGYNTNTGVTPIAAGQLGLGTESSTDNTSTPTHVSLDNLVAVDAKCDNAAALSNAGVLYVWGSNVNGQLGQGGAGGSDGTPSPVNLNGTPVIAMAVGCDFMLGLTNRGEVYAWGHNDHGQLGLGNTMDRYAPTPVPGASGAVSIAAGYNHAFAIMPDGTLRAWGRNDSGQLGIGSFANPQTLPVQVPGVTTAIGVAGGDLHSVLVSQSNVNFPVLSTTGNNDNNQLGVGTGNSWGVALSSFTLLSPQLPPPTMRRAGFTSHSTTGNPGFPPAQFLWRDTATGEIGIGFVPGFQSVGFLQGWSVIGLGDMNQDDLSEIFWHNPSTGAVGYWVVLDRAGGFGGYVVRNEQLIGFPVDPSSGWRPQKIADLDGDGVADILWRNVITGDVVAWYMLANGQLGYIVQLGWAGLDWVIEDAVDIDGNHAADIVWRNTVTGQVYVWLKNSLRGDRRMVSLGFVPVSWRFLLATDLDGDGRADLFWRDSLSGNTVIWYMSGTSFQANPTMAVSPEWKLAATYGAPPQLVWLNTQSGEIYNWRYAASEAGYYLTGSGGQTLMYRPAPGDEILPSEVWSGGSVTLNWQIAW